jgi:hypothetical protein
MGRGGLEKEKERVARRAGKKRKGWFSGLRELGLRGPEAFPLYLFYFLLNPFLI